MKKMGIIKLFVIALIGISLIETGCISYKAMLGTGYNYTFIITKPDTLKTMTFEDTKISIVFKIGLKSINFSLKNKTNETMKIIWDETAIIQNGKSCKIMHSGVKYTDRNSSQPPSIIPANTSIDDLVLPSDNVYYRQGYYSQYGSSPGGWEERDLFPMFDYNKPEMKSAILSSKGNKIGLYLPILFQGKNIEYNFEFTVSEISVVQSQP